MKCLFAMKFYSLIWHINEEAFGVRQRPGGSYRWPRCCSTPDNKHCNALLAAPPCCWAAGPALVFQRNTHLFPFRQEKRLQPSQQCQLPGSCPVAPTKHHQLPPNNAGEHCQLPWAHPHPQHHGGDRRKMQRKGRCWHKDTNCCRMA